MYKPSFVSLHLSSSFILPGTPLPSCNCHCFTEKVLKSITHVREGERKNTIKCIIILFNTAADINYYQTKYLYPFNCKFPQRAYNIQWRRLHVDPHIILLCHYRRLVGFWVLIISIHV